MANQEPGYYAIIPASVRYDDRLQANAKLLYGEITALTTKHGYCYATNDYLAKLYGVNGTTISAWISVLSKYGYIRSVVDKSNGNSRKIYLTDTKVYKLHSTSELNEEVLEEGDYSENSDDLIGLYAKTSLENSEDSNTVINKVSIKKKVETKIVSPILFEDDENEKLFSEFNNKLETDFITSVAFNDIVWVAKFKNEIQLGIDVEYYKQSVLDWNNTLKEKDKRKKRTPRGWVSTARTFMRSDNDIGKLKKLGVIKDETADMVAYLKS